MNIEQYLNEKGAAAEKRLREITDVDPGPFGLVKKAMEYSLFAGGKRIRPVLCVAAAEACGGDADIALTFGCALEMIHTYTLIHDDLPAMDNDDLRRGQPANHVVYGEAQALLAGCGLLTWAYEVMAQESVDGKLDPAVVARIIAETSHAIGWSGTMGGQSLDMIYTERGQVNVEELEMMEFAKTARLLIAAVRNGGLVAGADEVTLTRLTRFGEKIGLAFQVVDDVLDVVADQDKLGKPVGSDARQGKFTYVDRLGLDGARELLSQLLQEALMAVEDLDKRADALRGLAHFIVERAY
ncbi:MAG: polyprenyl synthetase family protein [Alphaproteobacteria bacterium]